LEPQKTYVVSLQTQLLCRVDAKKYKEQIQKNVDWLIEKAVKKGEKLMGWSYPVEQMADGSNTHFAVVALHTAAEAGAKVDPKVWLQIRERYVATQAPVGTRIPAGWSYYLDPEHGGERATLNMTTCALLGLTIARKHDKDAQGLDPVFEKGMAAWFELGSGKKSQAYEWFVTAELGRAIGAVEFKVGKKVRTWYREGAEQLIKEQKEDGSWVGKTGIDTLTIYNTACALYFLGPPANK